MRTAVYNKWHFDYIILMSTYQISAVWCHHSFINLVSITWSNRDSESTTKCMTRPPNTSQLVGWGPLVGKLANVDASKESNKLQPWDFSFFFSQTVILISENHKFIHLPFPLEVKCKGFRTEQASTSVTCQRAAEQKHIGIVSNTDIYIYL